MGRQQLREHVCGECGTKTLKQPFSCDGCGLVVETPSPHDNALSAVLNPAPTPEHWIWVRQFGRDDPTKETPLFCSWRCVQKHAESVAFVMAEGGR